MPSRPLPTLSELTHFLQSFFPPPDTRNPELPFLYHRPTTTTTPPTTPIPSITLSITPTPAFYATLHSKPTPHLAFLHRPWTLDRKRLPQDVTVLACHQGFDENLTVGANFALARRLGMDVDVGGGWGVVKGYKGDEGRGIGVVGGVEGGLRAALVKERVLREFGGRCEGCFGFGGRTSHEEAKEEEEGGVLLHPATASKEQDNEPITAIAIMNAFHPDEVTRALDLAASLNLISSSSTDGAKLLYLTGAIREPGLTFARDKGVRVICVGHRVCEEWGIGFLAERLREMWSGVLRVEEVYEEEEEGPREGGRRNPTQRNQPQPV
ncbi:hypothetical protein EJ03DRAFT_76680 [Teratosphaeria nubilosa]|uniref:NGG1p interacting factor 3 n=1 Tax=Teratosphaeria nubilosa TaxID=161662 RepID=A0A6G1LCB1_9PEZI|nr:hypothetical protein EJ03DRAFT_76680 [Teratosphaeria nubilosa]